MQEILLRFGWQIYESKNCCHSHKDRYSNSDFPRLSVTVILSRGIFIIRSSNRIIYTSYAANLEKYLNELLQQKASS